MLYDYLTQISKQLYGVDVIIPDLQANIGKLKRV